jgi:hypothetical protein
MNRIIANNLSWMLDCNRGKNKVNMIHYMDDRVWEGKILEDRSVVSKKSYNVDFYYNPSDGEIRSFVRQSSGLHGHLKIDYSRRIKDGKVNGEEDTFEHKIVNMELDDRDATSDYARKNLEESVRYFNMVMEDTDFIVGFIAGQKMGGK